MTEDEAKTKYCPMGGRKVSSKSGELSIGGFTQCIASDCMMWVATDNECFPSPPGMSVPKQPSYPAGYCGLINK